MLGLATFPSVRGSAEGLEVPAIGGRWVVRPKSLVWQLGCACRTQAVVQPMATAPAGALWPGLMPTPFRSLSQILSNARLFLENLIK